MEYRVEVRGQLAVRHLEQRAVHRIELSLEVDEPIVDAVPVVVGLPLMMGRMLVVVVIAVSPESSCAGRSCPQRCWNRLCSSSSSCRAGGFVGA
ncbi:MAG TPA: hypothetical protein ENJ18_13285 [Nannocystis exedens]|nr:hypothetical protein [Nannocystis exedens]